MPQRIHTIIRSISLRHVMVFFVMCGIFFGGMETFAQGELGQAQEQKKSGLGAALKAWLSGDAQTEQWKQQTSDMTIPEIRKMWPNRGGNGQYITIEGVNLGMKPGEIAFGKIGVSVKGDTNFPGECQNTWWQSNYVIVKVPGSLSAGRYKLRVKRADGKVSKEVSFQVTSASPSPGICGIVPDNGPLGIPLKIYGSNFGKQKGKVVIGSLEAQTPDTWERNTITTVTPVGDFSSGKVKVINASRSISNLLPFSVGQCTNTSCGEGRTCCSDGSCRLKGTCEEKIPLSMYEWTFFTGSLAKIGDSMCGIIGYVGEKKAAPILFEGLKRLEYRGYDSAGICTLNDRKSFTEKGIGKLDDLGKKIDFNSMEGTTGISHCRWATHGSVTKENAHPHSDTEGKISIVHNGIIENFSELKDELAKKGHKFKSETDTEVVAHLIKEKYKGDIEKAVRYMREKGLFFAEKKRSGALRDCDWLPLQ